jgi:hypothetical protein
MKESFFLGGSSVFICKCRDMEWRDIRRIVENRNISLVGIAPVGIAMKNLKQYSWERHSPPQTLPTPVAVYVRSTIQSSVSNYSTDNPQYELFWVRVGSDVFVAALYHPPKPTYKPTEILDYIEACVES